MPKLNLKFSDGTTAELEGTAEEIGIMASLLRGERDLRSTVRSEVSSMPPLLAAEKVAVLPEQLDIMAIVNGLKESIYSEKIEGEILNRSSQVDRVLLPLFVVKEVLVAKWSLTSGDIANVLKELGISLHISNISNTLAGAASQYVMADNVRTKGGKVKYKLSRKGSLYFQKLIEAEK